MIQRLILLVLTIFIFNNLQAQEVQFQVTVNTPKLQTADPKLFQNLESALQDFLNNQRWTEDDFEVEERIKCNIQLTITAEESANLFKADLAIQSVRPVYGTSYETPLLSHVDKDVTFKYEQFQPIDYSENLYIDNLSSVISFYVYVILGMDYDSFSPYGGDPYFQIAQNILNTVPQEVTGSFKGWRSLDGNRNRYWIIENILTPRVRPFRQANYDYHRLGLDVMEKTPESARSSMMSALEVVDQVNRAYPNSMILQMFANAKANEIIDVFKEGNPSEKSRVYSIMTKLDAANASKYRGISR